MGSGAHGGPPRPVVCWQTWARCPRRPTGGPEMALFMDVHHLDAGVTLDDVAKAHAADLEAQEGHDVQYLKYWVDEAKGTIFCLVDAPDPEAAADVHRRAHGLLADEIHPVAE